MCGIAGIYSRRGSVDGIDNKLAVMNQLIAHRGPDGTGTWHDQRIGLAHQRLSIIDLSHQADQPMVGENNSVIVFNGEIYNYRELREQLSSYWTFKTHSDTEVILAAYAHYGADCLSKLRGMFAFAIWDGEKLFAARDRFGIKPFYYYINDNEIFFASEAKALLPFVPEIATDNSTFSEYITFQHSISEHTLFKHIKQLMPAHYFTMDSRGFNIRRYWDVHYDIDHERSVSYFQHQLQEKLESSIKYHLVSDVPVGCYVSGGVDSSLVSALAAEHAQEPLDLFHGRFTEFPGYDESPYAHAANDNIKGRLHILDIQPEDFSNHIKDIIYALDYPVAGPGAFPQYMISQMVGQHVKVVMGGQGGDEIFGGYVRYVLAYFEQCIKAAINGTQHNGHFVVTPESIIPNLRVLQGYEPMMDWFWKDGLFGELDERYFRLINRSVDVKDEIFWEQLDREHARNQFNTVFNNARNVKKESYFDSMTHFDFKCLLPALLHVEDRMSMAHGVEARVPMLDHSLIEFAATIPADIKFSGGRMKHILKETFSKQIPQSILKREDKMGFPVPLTEWLNGSLHDFIFDIFNTGRDKQRDYINYASVLKNLEGNPRFTRKLWGFLSLELWQQQFHDQASQYRTLVQ